MDAGFLYYTNLDPVSLPISPLNNSALALVLSVRDMLLVTSVKISYCSRYVAKDICTIRFGTCLGNTLIEVEIYAQLLYA